MSNLLFSVFLNSYSDNRPSNAPSLSNVKWNRELDGIPCQNPTSQAAQLAPGENRVLFNGTRSLAQDGTTRYSIALKLFSTNTYVLSGVSGTLPNFRTPRVTGADSSTQITTSINGPVQTFASTGGTPLNLISGGVQVGDYVTIGNLFNALDQGTFQIIALTATSFSIENLLGVIEGPITLGSGYASQLQIFSPAGVQIGDTLVISGGFSPATQGSYKVTAVYANSLEFYSNSPLPQESNILTEAIALYSNAKQLIYLESDSITSVILNGVVVANIEPFVINTNVRPGVFLLKSTVFSLALQNNGINPANIFFASVE
jgi:hypothetical protein